MADVTFVPVWCLVVEETEARRDVPQPWGAVAEQRFVFSSCSVGLHLFQTSWMEAKRVWEFTLGLQPSSPVPALPAGWQWTVGSEVKVQPG